MNLLSSTVEKGAPLCLVLNKSGESIHYTYVGVGDTLLQTRIGDIRGETVERGSFASRAGGASWRRGSWKPAALPVDQWNRFKLLDEIAVRERAKEETETWNRFYSPLGIRDQMRMVIVRRGQLVGWLGLIGDSYYDEEDRRRADGIAPQIASLMGQAASLDEALFFDQPSYLVARQDGTIEYASEFALRLVEGDEARLSRFLGTIAPGVSTTGNLRTVGFTVTAMRRRRRWLKLVTFEPAKFIVQNELVGLPKRQREVLELLSNGSTNGEIAALLGISSSTVKYHLRALETALGVSDRIELVTVLGSGVSSVIVTAVSCVADRS